MSFFGIVNAALVIALLGASEAHRASNDVITDVAEIRSAFHRTPLATTKSLPHPAAGKDGWTEASDIATAVGFAIPYVPTQGKDVWMIRALDLLADRFGMTATSHSEQVRFIQEEALKIAEKISAGCRAMGITLFVKCQRAFTRVGVLEGHETTVDQRFPVTETTTICSDQVTPVTPPEADPLG